jgi:hypothetical protein
MTPGTSKKTELKLIGVEQASLEELFLDFQDYLRQHGLPQWPKGNPQALICLSIRPTICSTGNSHFGKRHLFDEGGFTERPYRVQSQVRGKKETGQTRKKSPIGLTGTY